MILKSPPVHHPSQHIIEIFPRSSPEYQYSHKNINIFLMTRERFQEYVDRYAEHVENEIIS